jgi:DNA (cytosine-5)-methyltransferase 1
MKVGSLFAGIGGFDLAAHWVGWETRWYSEIDPYACQVMHRHFPQATNVGDITTITNPPPVDVLCGGFPCQDISVAGKGIGIQGTRSGLWSHYARLIGEARPKWVVIENSPMLRSRGLGVVLQDLLALGYDAEWHCIPAASVGAHHERDRLFIVAYPSGQRSAAGLAEQGSWEEGLTEKSDDCRADSRSDGAWVVPSGWFTGQSNWKPEPNVGRVAHGVPHRVDRLRCLGNAIVPQVALRIFRAIQAIEDGR